jgi:hypothetical protein
VNEARDRWGRSEVSLLRHGVAAPLPLVGRGKGVGGKAFPSVKVSIDYRQLLLSTFFRKS